MAEKFPWKHILGFVLSMILTGLAVWLVVQDAWPTHFLIMAILGLAIAQVLLQLLLFMHLTERTGPLFHAAALAFGFFVAATVVGGSIWIMTFKSIVS